MERKNTTPLQPETLTPTPRIIEYADLLNIIQISIARKMDLPGAFEHATIAEVLKPFDPSEKRNIESEIGARFDHELVHFVTAALIAKHRPIIILAEASEGIGGYLPWEQPLRERLEENQARGIVSYAEVHVERYENRVDEQSVEALTREAQALAA